MSPPLRDRGEPGARYRLSETTALAPVLEDGADAVHEQGADDMASPRKIGLIIAIAAIAGTIGVAAIVWRPAMAVIEPPAPQSFDSALVKRGRELAAIGNCNDCHTVRGAKDFAGGLPVPTPFGIVYSSN